MENDLISRQAAIDTLEKSIKDCNPEHFVGNQKFIEYMDNVEIGSFGNWQFANGFNMGLTAAEVAIKKLPSAQPQPKRKEGCWMTKVYEYGDGEEVDDRWVELEAHPGDVAYCSVCEGFAGLDGG